MYMLYIFLLFFLLIYLLIYIKLQYRLKIIHNIIKLQHLQLELENDITYYIIIEKMINYEIELIIKFIKLYKPKKLKVIVIEEEEYKIASIYEPNFICKYGINIIPILLTKEKDGTLNKLNPHDILL